MKSLSSSLLGVTPGFAYAAQQTAAYGAQTTTRAPWYVMIGIVLAPGAAALFLTITCMTFIKRINRAAHREPLGVIPQVIWTICLGAVWGPLMQWGLQRITADLTGLSIYWELVIIAPFITGIAAMGTYEFILMPYLKKHYPGVYETMKVRHDPAKGHAGETENGDLTTFDSEDTTDPQ